MPAWVCAAAYLGCFGLGTMIAMALFTGAVGEASVQMGERLNQPDVPAKLSMLTSLFALTMGALWTLRASLELRLPQASLRLLQEELHIRAAHLPRQGCVARRSRHPRV